MDKAKKMVSPYACTTQKTKRTPSCNESYRYLTCNKWSNTRSWKIHYTWSNSGIWYFRSLSNYYCIYICFSYDSSFRRNRIKNYLSTVFWYCSSQGCPCISSACLDIPSGHMACGIFYERSLMDSLRKNWLSWTYYRNGRGIWCVYRYVT